MLRSRLHDVFDLVEVLEWSIGRLQPADELGARALRLRGKRDVERVGMQRRRRDEIAQPGRLRDVHQDDVDRYRSERLLEKRPVFDDRDSVAGLPT